MSRHASNCLSGDGLAPIWRYSHSGPSDVACNLGGSPGRATGTAGPRGDRRCRCESRSTASDHDRKDTAWRARSALCHTCSSPTLKSRWPLFSAGPPPQLPHAAAALGRPGASLCVCADGQRQASCARAASSHTGDGGEGGRRAALSRSVPKAPSRWRACPR
jgi:hypothetical protein